MKVMSFAVTLVAIFSIFTHAMSYEGRYTSSSAKDISAV